MLEERDQIGEGFVPGEHIGVGGFCKMGAKPVHDGVGDLVSDDVRRQAREDHLSGQVGARVVQVGAVVAEQDGLASRVEEGVASLERVRHQAQFLLASPPESSAEVPLEPFDDARSDGVDDLLV